MKIILSLTLLLTATAITIHVIVVVGLLTLVVGKYVIEAVREALETSIESQPYQGGGSC